MLWTDAQKVPIAMHKKRQDMHKKCRGDAQKVPPNKYLIGFNKYE